MIETDILRGVLLEEEQAPSTNELARRFTINPATAGKGLNVLIDRGILYKRRGLGMFVAQGAREKILSRRREEFLNGRLRELLREAESLGITREEIVRMIEEKDV